MKSFILLLGVAIFASCSQSNGIPFDMKDVDKSFAEVTPRIVLEKKGIKLIEANDFPLFSNCQLELVSDTNIFQFGPNTIELKLKNYTLSGSTADQDNKEIRLNPTGQFLYVITNKSIIKKETSSNFQFDLKRGKNSFFIVPSRSYEMSIKSDQSHLAYELVVFDTKETARYKRITEPGVFLCSPSGRYGQGDSEKLLLDFHLINTSISPEGNKIELNIDNKWSFTLDTWVPFYIEGLGDGRHSFSLQLMDKDGNELEGEYTSSGPHYISLQTIY